MKFCSQVRPTSFGRCPSCCHMPQACGPALCSGSASCCMTTWAAAVRCPAHKPWSSREHHCGAPLQVRLTTGFVYSDCQVDDARLVVLNARDAAAHGARISTRTEMRSARRSGDHWRILIEKNGMTTEVAARILVNAAGPWASEILRSAGVTKPTANLRLIKGSHIVVPRLFRRYAGVHPPERRPSHRLRAALRR